MIIHILSCGSPLGPNRWAIDLFGDESIQLVNVPGHTDGQAAIVVRNGGKFVLLAAEPGCAAVLCSHDPAIEPGVLSL